MRPHNLYATTEGLWGVDCAEHAGIHLFEDMTLRRERRRPTAAPCRTASRARGCCVTNLCNFTQPLIRLEVADAVTLDARAVPVRAHAAAHRDDRRAAATTCSRSAA